MQPIIEVKNLGKKYQIGEKQSYLALRDTLTNLAKSPLRWFKGKTKGRGDLAGKNDFWALQDLNFEIQKGEVIGIIGKNGAGKSTLLKVLSQITPPTTGEIKLRGRVGSLLEVGTGFNPELTGRENIFLNGAILGMRKNEIKEKLNQIIEFSGVEKFIDTPVKRYSSGMYVRLAFAVAAHLDPEILIIDEVLAVGDTEFQKKCLGKMSDITKEDGRTILFVSHNMAAIKQLCKRTILLENGKVKMTGDTSKVIDYYLTQVNVLSVTPLKERADRRGNQNLKLTKCYLSDNGGNHTSQIICGDDITLVFEYECKEGIILNNVVLGADITNENGHSLFICHSGLTKTDFGNISGSGILKCKIKRIPLTSGSYTANARIINDGIELDYLSNVLAFDVLPGDFFGTGSDIHFGQFYVEQEWVK